MKKTILFMMICLFVITKVSAQTWDQLTEEQKVMKLKTFRADNQKYLKEKLGMTATQLNDIDNVNLCYLSMLDRINRYGKNEENKEKVAQAATEARSIQLDIIMGEEKHKQYSEYMVEKIKKAKGTKSS
jgi:hypothetical protein